MSSLPRQGSPLRGREEDLGRLRAALDEGARVLTVVGPPGVGKTRLALRLAHTLDRRAGDPRAGEVLFCDLAATPTAEAMVEAVCVRWGLACGGGDQPAVAAALGRRQPSLVLLDNLEHLAHAAPAVLDDWVATTAPGCRFLLTSRVPLGLADERCFELQPLGAKDARRLLDDRVATSLAPRPSTRTEQRALTRLVELLEGLPLAIELAASKLALLSPTELLARLEQEGTLAGRLPRGSTPRRFASLSAAVDWSIRLLGPAERRALVCCLALSASFPREAAMAVIGDDERGAAEDRLLHLRRQSLIGVTEAEDGSRRLFVYQAVRARALAIDGQGRLLATARKRHARWYVDQAERLAATLGEEHPRYRAWLVTEHDNLRQAARHTRPRIDGGAGDAELHVRAVLALDRLLTLRGPFSDQLRRLDEALAHAAGLPRRLVGALRLARGIALRRAGQLAGARRELDEAAALARGRDARLRAEVLLARARTERIAGDASETTRALLRQARRVALGCGAGPLATSALALLGELEGRLSLLDKALAEAERSGALVEALYIRWYIGRVLRERGRFAEARSHFVDALADARLAGDRRLEAVVLGNLALTEHFAGELEAARERYVETLGRHRENGHRMLEGWILTCLGGLELQRGRQGEAETHAARAIAVTRQCDDVVGQAFACALLALALHRADDAAQAKRLLRRARRLSRDRATRDTVDAFTRPLFSRHLFTPHLGKRGAPAADAQTDGHLLHHLRLARIVAAGVAARPQTAPARRALTVGPDASWFEPPTAQRVSLQRRRPLRRILRRLVVQRRDAVDAAVSGDDLIAAGWPDERMSPTSASNRLRNAIATLRNLGLGETLLTRSDGYMLDPARPLRFAE